MCYISESFEKHLQSMADLHAAVQALIEHRRLGEQTLSLDELDSVLGPEN